jgi:hypothetical protein
MADVWTNRLESEPIPEHLWAKVLEGSSGCWYWMGGKDADGYGALNLPCGRADGSRSNYVVRAHRYFYQEFFGPIGSGLELDHLCRNRSCVNPTHLEPVTHAVNMFRAWEAKVRAGA